MTAPRFKNVKHHARPVNEVDGLKMKALESAIRWSGKIDLQQTGEVLDAFLAECEYPKRSGSVYYACASTGLLFDKQSGVCRQSSRVRLQMASVEPVKCSAKAFSAWQKSKWNGGFNGHKVKRGPKPKGYVAPQTDEEDEDDDYAPID